MSITPVIEKLRQNHRLADFDCGQPDLNGWLVKYAVQAQSANAVQTYVAVVRDQIIGYYSLTVGQVDYPDAPERLRKGLARYPIPVMLLARLAVHTSWQGQAVGTGLLKNAVQRTVQAADIAGLRALTVHAKDEAAQRYYEQFSFVPFLTNRLHLYILVKELRHLAGRD